MCEKNLATLNEAQGHGDGNLKPLFEFDILESQFDHNMDYQPLE